MHLSNFDTDAFLRDSWQQRPLLIRGAFPSWRNPLDPDELAGLACEPGVESRLITQGPGSWQLEHGPLPDDRFGTLGREPWTLLVQAVDHHVPEVAALLDAFRFIPNWRIDDVMVSYAVDGGGVGAHFDHYDVFLVQGLGTRRWQIGARCDAGTELLAHDDLRLLANFTATQEWLLEPGDILYVPPGVAHHGVAVGDDCMTYSIGFRAPSVAELVEGWAEHLVDSLPDDHRYTDAGLPVQGNPGEIAPAALDRMQAMIAEAMTDRAAFARWFGEYATTPRRAEIDWRPDQPIGRQQMRELLHAGHALLRNPASRFSFIREPDGVRLFVDGTATACTGPSAAFAERLCASSEFDSSDLVADRASETLLLELLNRGSVAFAPDA